MGFLNAIVTTIAPIFIVTSPITSYADQIWAIHKSRSSAGFSLDIPLIMLVASILKVYYWFGAHFSTALLLQALLMISIHLLLLHVALTNRPQTTHHTPFSPAPAGRPYDFWQWRMARPYWSFLTYFAGTLLVVQVLLGTTPLFMSYTALLGFVALAIEATLPLPQLYANQKRRGCKGFRVSVIGNWLVGDVFKMWFFFASGSGEGGVPVAFKLCGVFQMLCDIGLGVQWWVFGDGEEEGPRMPSGAGFGEKVVEEIRGPGDIPLDWEKARLG
ncbi:uncharacterized protein BDZ99DRAFT_504449 [Mytilinidion resinicola]|uniref:PQ loop repeat protein n=1 Tax=Mytilinidion resinicola TaxID=574789 RepID=A0A6A6XZC5_9PEZI|nr:uncharacterized protein BDZ99DRAFT_504449 [Mytilinidion resinicola]KAF2801760.1 hypothetical protein BDZ99DRAFT_504449 [Mytilinidion resinicola]